MRSDFGIRRLCGASTKAGMLAAFLLLAGCGSVPVVQPARVGEFGQALDKTRVQTDTAFVAINAFITEDEIDRAVTQPTLTEENVPVILKPEDIAKWDRAFSALDSYVANLTLLLSPDRAKGFATATEQLATEFAKLDSNALPSAGVAAGFAELGRLLIELKAQTDALAAARKADPGVQLIFSQMAAAIGESDRKGIRGTVREHWNTRMAFESRDFLVAKGNAAARKQIVLGYIELRDKRDAQDLQLGSLRQSLLDLAAAHSALARGSDVDLASAINMIQQELDATRALSDFFSSLKQNAKAKK
jgi:hypothetical protein